MLCIIFLNYFFKLIKSVTTLAASFFFFKENDRLQITVLYHHL